MEYNTPHWGGKKDPQYMLHLQPRKVRNSQSQQKKQFKQKTQTIC